MLILVILGQLFEREAHGYAIKQTIDRVLGVHKKISWGSLYPILKKLEKQSLVKKVDINKQSGGPKQKTYVITEAGKKYFHELMAMSEYSSGDARVIFRYKLLFFNKIKTEARTKIIKSYQQYCQEGIKSAEKHLSEIKKQRTKKTAYVLEVLNHSLETYQLEKEWAEKLLKKE